MASSGKKGRKGKGTVYSLQTFLSNGDAPAGTTQVSKKVRNYDGDDSDDGSNPMPLVYQLPTAPRANRILDDESIPHEPPFFAYLTNLPFDANEDDIHAFFGSIPLASLNLPRDGESGRVRGFGYVKLETRDDLINVLSLPDPSIKGRRIRIQLPNEHEQEGGNRQRGERGGNRRGFDGFGNSSENRDSTNWRRDTQSQDSFSGNSYDRGDRDRDRGFNRERRNERSEESSAPGSWRTRSAVESVSPRRDRNERQNLGTRTKNYEYDDRERSNNKDKDKDEILEERPKLNLKPRTLPLPEIVTKVESDSETSAPETKSAPKSVGVAPEKVFGSAKPVDTAARELEIEERLAETRRQEKLLREQEDDSVNEKLADLHLEKSEKENTNSAISWRRRNESTTNNKDDSKKNSPERTSNANQDDRRRDNRDRDYNRYQKTREKSDRSDFPKSKATQNRDAKQKDDNKTKRDTKSDRPLPKLQPNTTTPVLKSSNMYSGLDDCASE